MKKTKTHAMHTKIGIGTDRTSNLSFLLALIGLIVTQSRADES